MKKPLGLIALTFLLFFSSCKKKTVGDLCEYEGFSIYLVSEEEEKSDCDCNSGYKLHLKRSHTFENIYVDKGVYLYFKKELQPDSVKEIKIDCRKNAELKNFQQSNE